LAKRASEVAQPGRCGIRGRATWQERVALPLCGTCGRMTLPVVWEPVAFSQVGQYDVRVCSPDGAAQFCCVGLSILLPAMCQSPTCDFAKPLSRAGHGRGENPHTTRKPPRTSRPAPHNGRGHLEKYQLEELSENPAPHDGCRHFFVSPTQRHAAKLRDFCGIRGRASWQVRHQRSRNLAKRASEVAQPGRLQHQKSRNLVREGRLRESTGSPWKPLWEHHPLSIL
jgi:hypothetical protein